MRNTFVFSCCTGEASKYLHNEKNSNIHNGRKKQYNKTLCTHQATLTNINTWSISFYLYFISFHSKILQCVSLKIYINLKRKTIHINGIWFLYWWSLAEYRLKGKHGDLMKCLQMFAGLNIYFKTEEPLYFLVAV